VLEASALPSGRFGELVFTDEQLTLLGDLAGEPGFPGARRPQLDAEAWAAVAQGLAARGTIHDDGPQAGVRLADAALGIALYADRWLWITIRDALDEELGGQDIIWLAGGVAVRHTVTTNGFHHFAAGTVEDLVAELLMFVAAAGGPAAARRTLTAAELAGEFDGAARIVSCNCSLRSDPDRIAGRSLTLAESTGGGLWVLETDSAGTPVLEPVTVQDARERVRSLVATLG
jgi:hypothetical protein